MFTGLFVIVHVIFHVFGGRSFLIVTVWQKVVHVGLDFLFFYTNNSLALQLNVLSLMLSHFKICLIIITKDKNKKYSLKESLTYS